MQPAVSTRVVCRACHQSFKDERGLKIHVGKTHGLASSLKRREPEPTDPVELETEAASMAARVQDAPAPPEDVELDPPIVFRKSHLEMLVFCYGVLSSRPSEAPKP